MQDKKLIVFVCKGNIARSPFAEAITQKELIKKRIDDKYRVISRGVQGTVVDPQPVKFSNIVSYKKLYQEAKPILDKFKVDLSDHSSQIIDEETAHSAAIILAMDQRIQDDLLQLFPKQKEKIYLFSELIGKRIGIVDPETVSGVDTQNNIFTGIYATIINGLPTLLSLTEQ